MCSLMFQSPDSRVKLFYISTLLPKRLDESEIRGLVHANTAWFCHDQDHFSSEHCGNKDHSNCDGFGNASTSVSLCPVYLSVFQLVDVVETTSRSLAPTGSYPR